MYDHTSLLSSPCPPLSFTPYVPSPVFPSKSLPRSSFAFATDVPFTDLFLIYNIYGPVVSLPSLFSCIPSRCPGFVSLTFSLLSSTVVGHIKRAGPPSFRLLIFSFSSPFIRVPSTTHYSQRNGNCREQRLPGRSLWLPIGCSIPVDSLKLLPKGVESKKSVPFNFAMLSVQFMSLRIFRRA